MIYSIIYWLVLAIPLILVSPIFLIPTLSQLIKPTDWSKDMTILASRSFNVLCAPILNALLQPESEQFGDKNRQASQVIGMNILNGSEKNKRKFKAIDWPISLFDKDHSVNSL